jgi:predicted RNA binding protein YcfA (HicA-like mRNA interferase family)
LKSLSGKEMIILLESYGWKLAGIQVGPYVMVKMGYVIRIPVPGNKSLKIGLQNAILKQANIDL